MSVQEYRELQRVCRDRREDVIICGKIVQQLQHEWCQITMDFENLMYPVPNDQRGSSYAALVHVMNLKTLWYEKQVAVARSSISEARVLLYMSEIQLVDLVGDMRRRGIPIPQ